MAGGGGGAAHRLEERRRAKWRRGGATSGGLEVEERRRRDESSWSLGGEAARHWKGFIRALRAIVNPKLRAQRRQPPALKQFRGVRGEFWTPWRRLGERGDAIRIHGAASPTPSFYSRLDA